MLNTKSYKKTSEENRLYPVFGTADVCSSLFGRVKSFFAPPETMDNTNVNIVPFAHKQLYALTETHYLMRVNPENLDISKRLSVTRMIPTSKTITAHPHVEPDGSWIDMGMNISVPGYEFVRYDGNGLKDPELSNILESGKVINCIPAGQSLSLSYFHSFGLSQNYIIFLEHSLKFSFTSFATGLFLNKSYSEALHMDPKCNTRVHLINKTTGEIVQQKYHTDPMFLFHHINAYEQEKDGKTEIVVDICAYDANHFDIKKLRYEDMFTDRLIGKDCIKSVARRITIPLDLASFSSESIHCNIKDLNSNVAFELPTINYAKYNAKPYKYFYGLNYFKKPFSVVKMNVENPSEILEFKYDRDGKEYLPSEPVFVENPNGTSEDDGVLLIMVLANDNDYLSVLDAKSLTEIARAVLPPEARGSMTFHGFFADSQNFKSLS